jgi:signal transduction histidine kinase
VSEPPGRRFEREVRNVLVGGLAFVLFLAGASLVVMTNTERWGAAEGAARARAQATLVAERLASVPDAGAALAGDGRSAAALREANALAAALYDAAGMRIAEAPFLPEPSLTPARLTAADLPPEGTALVREGTREAPAILSTLCGVRGRRSTLLVVSDASAVAAVRRNARVLRAVVPVSAIVLAVLVTLFLKRLVTPIEALAETARDAGIVVSAAPQGIGEPEQAIATFARTIEELKRRSAELEALREREKERADALAVTAETLVRSHPGGLLVVDAAGRLTQANAPALEALGLAAGAVGTAAEEALRRTAPLTSAVRLAAGGEPTLALEFTSGEGGLARQLAVTAVPVADAARRPLGTLLFLEDRTTTARLQRELSTRRELAALGEMSAGIAHEFRNATATILGYARLAAGAEDDASRQRHLAAIRTEAQHVARVTGDFLFFARPERLSPERAELGPVVRDIVEEERLAAPATRFSVEGTFAVALVDVALLRRALVNMLRNAADAASAGGVGGAVLVRGEGVVDGAARLAVEDDGPGVRETDLPNLFVPFFSTKESGTGLGLPLVARIAALHGGSVRVERSPALGGARFVLDLPA